MPNPFQQALSTEILTQLHPLVQAHFTQTAPVVYFQGTMHRIWRVGGWKGWLTYPFLVLGSLMGTLFPNTGKNIPFELTNTLQPSHPKGEATLMGWHRSFYFPEETRAFNAVMGFDADRQVILDWFGLAQHLEVEILPTVEAGGTMVIRSGKQWLTLGYLKLPIPYVFSGQALVKEWVEDEAQGLLGISVTLSNPLIGDFFGYEGQFSQVAQVEKRPLPSFSWAKRFQLAAIAFGGTFLYAFSFYCLLGHIDGALLLFLPATIVGLSAGISWMGFGLGLLAVTQSKPSIAYWIDTCLGAMQKGMVLLGIAAVLNGLLALLGKSNESDLYSLSLLHFILLLMGDVVMGTHFVKKAIVVGLSPLKALLLWVVGLNGLFGVLAYIFSIVLPQYFWRVN